MKKWSALVLIFISFSLMTVFFNNCSESKSFTNSSSEEDTSLNSQGSSGSIDDEAAPVSDVPLSIDDTYVDGTISRQLSNEEEAAILDNLTEDEINNPVPITELQNDPSLFDTYMCGSNGIAICHFPENIDSQGSKCVGRPSVDTHYTHFRIYFVKGEERSIGDYLGPCRTPLYD